MEKRDYWGVCHAATVTGIMGIKGVAESDYQIQISYFPYEDVIECEVVRAEGYTSYPNRLAIDFFVTQPMDEESIIEMIEKKLKEIEKEKEKIRAIVGNDFEGYLGGH